MTDEFKKAGVHELESIIQLVDTQALYGENLDFIIEWTMEGSQPNTHYGAQLIIWFLQGLEER